MQILGIPLFEDQYARESIPQAEGFSALAGPATKLMEQVLGDRTEDRAFFKALQILLNCYSAVDAVLRNTLIC